MPHKFIQLLSLALFPAQKFGISRSFLVFPAKTCYLSLWNRLAKVRQVQNLAGDKLVKGMILLLYVPEPVTRFWLFGHKFILRYFIYLFIYLLQNLESGDLLVYFQVNNLIK